MEGQQHQAGGSGRRGAELGGHGAAGQPGAGAGAGGVSAAARLACARARHRLRTAAGAHHRIHPQGLSTPSHTRNPMVPSSHTRPSSMTRTVLSALTSTPCTSVWASPPRSWSHTRAAQAAREPRRPGRGGGGGGRGRAARGEGRGGRRWRSGGGSRSAVRRRAGSRVRVWGARRNGSGATPVPLSCDLPLSRHLAVVAVRVPVHVVPGGCGARQGAAPRVR